MSSLNAAANVNSFTRGFVLQFLEETLPFLSIYTCTCAFPCTAERWDASFSQEDNKATLLKFVRSKCAFKQPQFTAKTMQSKKKRGIQFIYSLGCSCLPRATAIPSRA